MKADEVQRSLPRRLKDYNRNTDELKEKVVIRKAVEDPMCLMNEYLKKSKRDSVDKEQPRERKEKKVVTKEELKRQRKKLLRKIKRDRKKTRHKERERDSGSKRIKKSKHKRKRSSRH